MKTDVQFSDGVGVEANTAGNRKNPPDNNSVAQAAFDARGISFACHGYSPRSSFKTNGNSLAKELS